MSIKSLVTGGCGFIGSHLVELLVASGDSVVVVDNLSTGSAGNIGDVLESGAARLVEADAQDTATLTAAMTGCDRVFHLAALADIVPSIVNPLGYFAANVAGTVSALEAARATGVRRFVYTASSSCYGIPDQIPTPETADIRPEYPYAFTKWMGEAATMHWNRVYGLPTVSLRLFNVYGPRARTTGTYGAVFGVFLAQKLAGEPMTIVGDGTQSRDFTFVTDVARAFLAAAESDVVGMAFNVGSGGTYTINRLVELLGGSAVHIPKRPGEPDSTYAETSRIRSELGWAPQVSFEDGVATMLRHIEDWRDAPVWNAESIADATVDWFRYLAGSASPATSRRGE